MTTNHPPGTFARITWAIFGSQRIDRAIRADDGYWRTAAGAVIDELVTTVVPLVDVDITDPDALGQIVDNATRNGDVTVASLRYALREHRDRMQPRGWTFSSSGMTTPAGVLIPWDGAVYTDTGYGDITVPPLWDNGSDATVVPQRPEQHPATNTNARKALAEKAAGGEQ